MSGLMQSLKRAASKPQMSRIEGLCELILNIDVSQRRFVEIRGETMQAFCRLAKTTHLLVGKHECPTKRQGLFRISKKIDS